MSSDLLKSRAPTPEWLMFPVLTNNLSSLSIETKASAKTFQSSSSKSPSFFDTAATFNTPTRKPLRVNPFTAIFNICLSFGLTGLLITGYVIGLRVVDLGVTSIGLYGIILISEYLIQLGCALFNRLDINQIAKKYINRSANARQAGDCEKGIRLSSSTYTLSPDADVSVAVVGYREDDEAWRRCVRSLTTQTLRPKCVVGVVDGNEKPDLDMAEAFVQEFKSTCKAPHIKLPISLSELHRETYFRTVPADNRWWSTKVWHWFAGRARPGHQGAMALARQVVIDQVLEWNEKWNISSLEAVCFSQPHGHKRTAMFTAFAMSLYALRTRDGIFTTDSDTNVQENALDELVTLLHSSPQIGGVTADVKIENKADGLLARLCSARYWFAFNIERACQSFWRCVGCLSGPMSMYRSCDLDTIMGPWNLQTFGDKATTFGDDRHLTNLLLSFGLSTRYTHRTWCDSESPTQFSRWIAQQTRWSKSFFREAFWFPKSFVYHSPWLLLETTIQTLYPFILITTIMHTLFSTADASGWRPVILMITMFGIAFFKSFLAMLIAKDPWLLLFSGYGFFYFFGLLPSKIFALFTMNATGWGTSARSQSERKRGQSFLQKSFQVGHLVLWYTVIFVGLGFFVYKIMGNPFYFFIGCVAILPSFFLYWNKSPKPATETPVVVEEKKNPMRYSTPFEVDEAILPHYPPSTHESLSVGSFTSTEGSSRPCTPMKPTMKWAAVV